MKTSDFTENSKVSEEMKKRTRKISPDTKYVLARDNLSEAFKQLSSYENDFRDFNNEVKRAIRMGKESPIEYSLETFNRNCEEKFYQEKLRKAKEHGADISGLPTKLNYLEGRN